VKSAVEEAAKALRATKAGHGGQSIENKSFTAG